MRLALGCIPPSLLCRRWARAMRSLQARPADSGLQNRNPDAMCGVQAYPDPVRVVSVGKAVDALLADPENKENAANSIEFCGGTHLDNTSDADDFAILSESGIAQGAPALRPPPSPPTRRCRHPPAALPPRTRCGGPPNQHRPSTCVRALAPHA